MGAVALDLQTLELAKAANRAFEMVRPILSRPSFNAEEREALRACEESLEKVLSYAVWTASHSTAFARRYAKLSAASEMRAVVAAAGTFRPQIERLIAEMRAMRQLVTGEAHGFLTRTLDLEERANTAMQAISEVFRVELSDLEARAKSDPVLLSLINAPVDDEPLTEEDDQAAEEAWAGFSRREFIEQSELVRELRAGQNNT
jgi:hypothetical protein